MINKDKNDGHEPRDKFGGINLVLNQPLWKKEDSKNILEPSRDDIDEDLEEMISTSQNLPSPLILELIVESPQPRHPILIVSSCSRLVNFNHLYFLSSSNMI